MLIHNIISDERIKSYHKHEYQINSTWTACGRTREALSLNTIVFQLKPYHEHEYQINSTWTACGRTREALSLNTFVFQLSQSYSLNGWSGMVERLFAFIK